MKSESPIGENFFYSSQFCDLIKEAKKFQLENAKNKINNLNNPENPIMNEIFDDENLREIKKNNNEYVRTNRKNAGFNL